MEEKNQSSAESKAAESEGSNVPSETSLATMAPVVHQDLRKIRVDPAFSGEDDQTIQLDDDVQDDSDINAEEESDEESEFPEPCESATKKSCTNDEDEIVMLDSESKVGSSGDAKNDAEVVIMEDEKMVTSSGKVDEDHKFVSENVDDKKDVMDEKKNIAERLGSQGEECTIEISDEEEETIVVESDNDAELLPDEELSDDHDLSEGEHHSQNLGESNSDEDVTEMGSESECVRDTIKTSHKQLVKSKGSKGRAVVATSSGKFLVKPNKYTSTEKQKAGKYIQRHFLKKKSLKNKKVHLLVSWSYLNQHSTS